MKISELALWRKRTEEIGLAIALLTRFPLPAFKRRTNATVGSAFWAYPLAGALVGAASAVVFWLSVRAGFATSVAVLLAMAASILLGGGFHEDGLSDFWDGLGSGRTREDKLAIMRDSHIGAYGVLALILTLGLQIALLINLHHYAGLQIVVAALIASEMTARGAIALPIILLTPARKDGLGRLLTEVQGNRFIVALLIATVLPTGFLGLYNVAMIGGVAIGAASITFLAWHFLGGFTGDVLGATAMTARITGLGALVLMVTP